MCVCVCVCVCLCAYQELYVRFNEKIYTGWNDKIVALEKT